MRQRRRRVLVVYKKDAYQQYIEEQRDPRLRHLLRKRHPDVLDMQRAHAIHQEAIEAVVQALRRLPVEVDLAYRAGLKVAASYHLVISVGGDGTLLQAARSAKSSTPILGINSDPLRSEAVFCAATRATCASFCRQALEGELPSLLLYRLQAVLNDKPLRLRALNDVLVVHDDPATMSRYRLRVGVEEEVQKSSGVWVATAAGSSSAVLAAGGVRIPWASKQFQYRPRELYRGRLSQGRLAGGVLRPPASVRVTWLMRRGLACLDGPHVKIPLRFGDRVEIRLSLDDPVRLLGLEPSMVPHPGKRKRPSL